VIDEFNEKSILATISRTGYLTYTSLLNLKSERSRNKITYQKLKKGDEVVGISLSIDGKFKKTVIITKQGNIVNTTIDITIGGLKRVGDRCIHLAKNDQVAGLLLVNNEDIVILDRKGKYARLEAADILENLKNKPLPAFKVSKTSTIEVVGLSTITKNSIILVYTDDLIKAEKSSIFKKIKLGDNGLTYQKNIKINHSHCII